MRIIDLLNKIANGEEVPKRIKKTWEYEWKYDHTREIYCYMTKLGERFDEDWLVINMLNDEVEIIDEVNKEEKKIPEKLEEPYYHDDMAHKINEILDYLKSKGE